ncbi:hypothetical protein SAMN05444336_10566 [Albimonas donghaensis]|uniref:Lipoprotein n=2 Tax=Albimonas donghaensis TaxID=356660 RepID=A0A1H3BKS0_9RHOB|nr:hypothetical protein SAMN05444336_10566 [Albimonas donghaensis]
MRHSWMRGAFLALAASGLSACLGGIEVPIPDIANPFGMQTPARQVTVSAPTSKSEASAVAGHRSTRVASASFDRDALMIADCYTVDPYKPIRIAKPAPGAPGNAAAYLGQWGGGAWDGRVCHDLWVMEVSADGKVLMFDAHGPGYRQDATGFLRRGEITPDGRIRVRKGGAMVTYWIEDGVLYGERLSGQQLHRIMMRKKS